MPPPNTDLFAFVGPLVPPAVCGAARLAVKDNIDAAGWPTRCGSALTERAPATSDAAAVARLRAAGFAVIGKTALPELAFGGWGSQARGPAPCNPWDERRTAGGSSSGSAVAVAAGLADLALGSDTGGSVRIPAAMCGVVGIRPSLGRVSRVGLHGLAPSFDTIGPLAQSVTEAWRALTLIAGPDPADPATLAPLPPLDASPNREITLVAPTAAALGASSRAVRDGFETAIATLGAAGVQVIRRDPPIGFAAIVASSGTILGFEAARLYGHLISRAGEMDPAVATRLAAGATVSKARFHAAQATRRREARLLNRWLGPDRVLATPTCPLIAPLLDEIDEADTSAALYTRTAGYCGWTALSVPCGLSPEALPIGLQLSATHGGESLIAALAARFEAERGALLLPPLSANRSIASMAAQRTS